MPELTIPAVTVGIDHISHDTSLPRGAVRDGVNTEFDRDGNIKRRRGARLVSGNPVHSLWRGKGLALCVRGSKLCRVDGDGAIYELGDLPSSAPMSYADLKGTVIAGNPSALFEVSGTGIQRLGVEDGQIGTATPASMGGLPAGRYAVALGYLRGTEEGGLSEILFVDVPEGGGIQLDNIPQPTDATTIRVYRSTPGGDALYRADDLPAGLTSFLAGNLPVGRINDTQHLRRMPGGSIVRAWRGRLLVARGRTLYLSEPLRYGLYSPRTGFVQEARPIKMVAPVEGGVFVGTDQGVVFYRGSAPSEWVRVQTAAAAPVPGSDHTIQSGLLDPRLQVGSASELAAWLSPNGFVLGLPDGGLIQPQQRRIALNASSGRLATVGRRVASVVQ